MKEAMIPNHSGEFFRAIKRQDFSNKRPTTLRFCITIPLM